VAGQLTAYIAASPFEGMNNSVEDHMANALRGKIRNLGAQPGLSGSGKLTSGNTEVRVGIGINHLPKYKGSTDSRLRKWNPMTVPYEYP